MRSSPTQMVRRRVNIDFDPARSQEWFHSRKEVEYLMNAISFILTPGERFFIRSVQNYQERITDPVLQAQISDFIHQEAMHAVQHARCNRALAATFPFGPEIELLCRRMLRFFERIYPKSWQLAITCALEHFTTILADTLLRHQDAVIECSEPEFAALWLWHTAEEIEHKSVCFDLYSSVVGRGVLAYLCRIFIMAGVSMTFLSVLFFSYRKIRKIGRTPDSMDSGKQMTEENPRFWRLLKEVAPPKLYFDYYRPSFHPWMHDNLALLEQWKERYRGFGLSAPGDGGNWVQPSPVSALVNDKK
jgi:uncharacterized protein